ncbi:MAG TPA: glutathione peroxidase [Nevskiaceae bacterium]|nr:glutathione peroxidase [Nevskiaceae bacterium]
MFTLPTRVAVLLLALSAAGPVAAACEGSLLDHRSRRLLGGEERLCETYAGKVVLVVNTASQCGYTPQYEGLEALYRQYRERGLVVLGFPSDQFGGQEFDSEAEIAEFCKVNYGVSFPMFGKTQVKDAGADPLFQGLIKATGQTPSWNFNKYLVGRDGRAVRHFPSSVKPDSPALAEAIEAALKP